MRMLCRNPCACHTKSTLNQLWISKNVPRPWCFNVFTSKPFSRAGVVQILATSTSKSDPTLSALRFWLPNRSRAQAWCKFWRLQLPKVLRTSQVLTILLPNRSRAHFVVQILASSTSKSAPTPSVFNDFDFQIALARGRGANFDDVNFQKCSETVSL